MKFIYTALLLLSLSIAGFAQGIPPTQWTEADGLPRRTPPTKVILPNGSMSCVGGTCTITFSGGAGTVTTPGTLTANKIIIGNGSSSIVASKVTLTDPATAATITIADNKTLTLSNTLTFAGTDSTVHTFPSTTSSVARIDAAQTFTGNQTFGGVLLGSNGSAAAPTYAFTNSTNLGFFRAAASAIGVSAGGTSYLRFDDNSGFFLRSDAFIAFASDASFGTRDIVIGRDAAGVLRVSDNATTAPASLMLAPAAASVGTSGVGVFVIGGSTAPSSTSADTAQLYTVDWNGAGTAAFHMRNEENGIYIFGSKFKPPTTLFADLGTPADGTMTPCTDCTVTGGADNTCAGSGTGALAVRLNSVWRCFAAQN